MTKLLLSASISGGIIVLLWCLSYPLSKKIFNASWHYFILKTAMLFMLIPLSVLAPLFSSLSLSEKSVYSESEPESFTTHDIITMPPVYVEPDNAIQPVYEDLRIMRNLQTQRKHQTILPY